METSGLNNSSSGLNKCGVAIVGVGFRFPGSSNDPKSLWNNLINKFDGVVENDRWNKSYFLNNEIKSNQAGLISLEDEIKKFDPLFFSIAPSEVDTIDPQQRLLLKCTWEALEDGGIDPIKLRGSNTSVFVGISTSDYFNNLKNPKKDALTNILGSTIHGTSNRISYCYDFRGQSFSLDSACSSSSNAIALGYQSIAEGRSNLSVVGGTNLILDENYSKSFSHSGILGSGRCKTFSEDADGFVRGEGIGIAILKNLDQAINDGDKIYCVLNGVHSNSDGNFDKNNFYAPSKTGQYNNILELFKSIDIKESDIDYCETHGTGTLVGDPVEVEALSMAFSKYHSKDNQLLISSLKSNIGHLEACSGIASLIKCCLMFRYRKFIPSIHFNKPNPAIKFDEWNIKVLTEVLPFPNNKKVSIFINNFGITASNVAMVVSEFNQNYNNHISYKSESNKSYFIPFSANSKQSLNNYLSIINNNHNSISNSCEFFDFVQTQILSKSTQLYQRAVILANKWSDVLDNNNIFKTNNSISSNLKSTENLFNSNICFVFSGQGTQYNKMALELYQEDSVFRSTIDLFDSKLSKYYGYSVFEKLKSLSDDTIYNNVVLAQPAIIMIQLALFETLTKKWNIKPNFIIGHSLGELSSQFASGSLDIDTFCYLVYHRSISQQKTVGLGRMLAINISSDQFIQEYSSTYPNIEIACYNSPNSIVISGDFNELKEIEAKLKSQGILAVFLTNPSSFHGKSQDQLLSDFINLKYKLVEPTIPVLSTVYQDFFNSDTRPFSPEYCFRTVREPVYFEQTIKNLYKHIESNQLNSNLIFIELSPHTALNYHLKQLNPSSSSSIKTTVLSTLNKNKSDVYQIYQLISTLYCNHNYPINFKNQLLINESNSYNNNYNSDSSLQQSYKYKELDLPRYQWDDGVWYSSASKSNGSAIDVLGNKSLNSPLEIYKTSIDIKKPLFQYLKGHIVKGKYCLPTAAFIENIFNIFSGNDIMVNNLEFKSPVILIEGKSKKLQSSIYQISKTDYRIQFHHHQSNKWNLTANCNFQLYNGDNSSEKKLDIQDLLSKHNIIVSSKEFYNKIKFKNGISYSGVFQSVQECFISGEDSVLCKVKFSKFKDNINCSSLDGCFQTSLFLVEEFTQILIDRFEGLTYYGSNLPKDGSNSNLYVFSKLITKKDNKFEFSIVVALDDGTILIELDKIVFTSSIPVIDQSQIEYPSNEIQTTYLQLKKCEAVTNLDLFNYNDNIHQQYKIDRDVYFKFIPSIFYHYIKIKVPNLTIQEIQETSIQKLKEKYLIDKQRSRPFSFVFETIKNYYQQEFIESEWSEENLLFCDILTKSTKVMVDILFPFGDQLDSPASLYENGLMENLYNHPFYRVNQDKLSEIIKESIRPLLKKKNVIRIFEAGGGVASLSNDILSKLYQLLIDEKESNGLNEIEIEYTFSDISTTFLQNAKEKLSYFNQVGSVIFKVLDLEKNSDFKQLKPNYYDFVVMSGVLHVVKNIAPVLGEIHKVLKDDGYLLLVEPCYKSILADSIYCVYDQWWAFEDTNLREDSCSMTENQWHQVLNQSNFDNIKFSNNNQISNILIHSQKINNNSYNHNQNNIILYSDYNNNNKNNNNYNNTFITNILKQNQEVNIINSIEQFNNISNKVNSDSIIYFTKTINQLNTNNFKEISFEYIQIVQYLLKNNLKSTKLVLITSNSNYKESSNYLSASVTGCFRFFLDQLESLLLFSFDFDNISLLNENNNQLILNSIDKDNNVEREFIVRDNKLYIERIKFESSDYIYKKYISKSIEDKSNNQNLYSRLNENLEFQLESKLPLGDDQVEVQVKAFGLNYKDYLVYAKELPSVGFSSEFSGIIKSVGRNVNTFKVGDQVYSIHCNSSSSHIIVDKSDLCIRPRNLSDIQAASIPFSYLTSYYSIFKIGNLSIKNNDSILIHNGTNGIGLSAIEILKWKGFKSHLFVTIDSKEKEMYLKNKYGSFISGIYSTNNKDYTKQIKERLKELGSKKEGVDLILNTLSSEYMETNLKCLNPSGHIVDLCNNHLHQNEFRDYSKFKFNYGYSNVELLSLDFKKLNNVLNKISGGISDGSLSLIPITEYSVNNIKEAFEFINQRKHIGKIVINYDKEIKKEESNNSQPIIKANYSINEFGETVLFTGQSGIALEVIRWISKHSDSVKNIIILSKSKLNWELELVMNKPRNKRINYYFKSVDIEYLDQMEDSINQIFAENKHITNIDSILHFAFIHHIVEPLGIDLSSVNISHGAKTLGAINLHNLSLKYNWSIKNFIIPSSISSFFGIQNQCTYVSSNTTLDSLVKYRRSIGLPALGINFGHIGSSGSATRNSAISQLLIGIGLEFMNTNLLLGTLDLFIQNQKTIDSDYNNIILNRLDFDKLKVSQLYTHKFSYKINSLNSINNSQNNINDNNNEIINNIVQIVISKIADLLSINESNINTNIPLSQFGGDSLFITQTKIWLDKIKRNLFTISEIQKYSINDIIKKILNHNINKQ